MTTHITEHEIGIGTSPTMMQKHLFRLSLFSFVLQIATGRHFHGLNERCAFVPDVKSTLGSKAAGKGKSWYSQSSRRPRQKDYCTESKKTKFYGIGLPLRMSDEIRTTEFDDSSTYRKQGQRKNSEKDGSLDLSEKQEKSQGMREAMSNSPRARFFGNDFLDTKPPPFQIEDVDVLFYDVFLIINLALSISFWVVHRMSIDYVGSAFGEGSLLSILWIGSGLYYGSFLNSAVDGHYGSSDERGGPKAAGLLGLQTFIGAINLRLVFALISAVLEHRQVGVAAGEQLIPLEIAFGLVLMSMWRALHSSFTPRV